MEDAPYFPSKRDTWITCVVWLGTLTSVGAGFAVLLEGTAPPLAVGILAICWGTPPFMLFVFYRTGYTLDGDTLRIRSGPFVWSVPLPSIESVTPSRNPLSSPACSLDRLHLRWRGSKRGVLVSPADKSGFLHALAQRCPQLRLMGDRLAPADAPG